MKSSIFTDIRRDDRREAFAQSATSDRALMDLPPEKSWLRRILDNLYAQEPSIEEGLTLIAEMATHSDSPNPKIPRSFEPGQPSRPPANPQSRKASCRSDRSQPTMIKSGLAEDFAYRVYADGSIEAKLRHGSDCWLRFASIDALRLHLGFALLQRAGSGAAEC